MYRSVRAGVLAALFVVPAAGAVALDYGGNLNSRSDLRPDESVFRNVVSGWVRSNPVIGDRPTARTVLEANVTNRLTVDEDGEIEEDTFVDLDLAFLRGIFPGAPVDISVFEVTAGRHGLSEPSGLILDDRVDGLSFSLDLPRVSVILGGGYTGLIDGRNTGVLMTATDEASVIDEETRAGSERIVTSAVAELPELFAMQNLSFGTLAQWDYRDRDLEETAERLDSQYLFGALEGPLSGSFYYNAGVSLNRNELAEGGAETTGFGLGASLEGEIFLGEEDATVLTGSIRYGSGEGNTLESFRPISAPDIDVLNPLRGEDILMGMIDYAIRPFAGREGAAGDWLQASGYTAASFLADVGDEDAYEGVEAGLRLATRPFSDLGGQLRVAGFSPGDDPGDIEVLGRVELSASF